MKWRALMRRDFVSEKLFLSWELYMGEASIWYGKPDPKQGTSMGMSFIQYIRSSWRMGWTWHTGIVYKAGDPISWNIEVKKKKRKR